jgi:hypothetical protein
MMPREHGAYAQIAFPLITALALVWPPNAAALLLVVSIVVVFLLHEPVMVLTGARGGRVKREAEGQARRTAAWLVVVALAAGVLGLWLAGRGARLSALIPLALGALLTPLIFSRQEKTAAGELLVATTLPATMIPVAMAGGASLRTATIAAAVWAIVFSLSTVTVRAIIARAKKNQDPGLMPFIAPALSAASVIAAIYLASRDIVPPLAAVAVVPTALVALAFGAMGVHPRNLKRMGWTLVASNLAVLAALLIGLS